MKNLKNTLLYRLITVSVLFAPTANTTDNYNSEMQRIPITSLWNAPKDQMLEVINSKQPRTFTINGQDAVVVMPATSFHALRQ